MFVSHPFNNLMNKNIDMGDITSGTVYKYVWGNLYVLIKGDTI